MCFPESHRGWTVCQRRVDGTRWPGRRRPVPLIAMVFRFTWDFHVAFVITAHHLHAVMHHHTHQIQEDRDGVCHAASNLALGRHMAFDSSSLDSLHAGTCPCIWVELVPVAICSSLLLLAFAPTTNRGRPAGGGAARLGREGGRCALFPLLLASSRPGWLFPAHSHCC